MGPWRVRAIGALAGVGALVTTGCPTSVSGAAGRADLPPIEIGGEVAAVEVAFGGGLGAGADWSRRTVTLELVVSAPVVVEVADPAGRVDVVGLPEGEATATVEQDCAVADCSSPLALRVQPLAAGAAVVVEGSVAVEGGGFGDATDDVDVEVADPRPIGAAALARTSPLGPPSTLAISSGARVAAGRVTVDGCDEVPWVVAAPVAGSVAGAPEVRVVDTTIDRTVVPGAAVAVDGCVGGERSFWVVLAAPVTGGEIAATWSVLGADPSSVEVSRASVSTTESEVVDLAAAPVTPAPVPLPAAGPALHLVEGVAVDDEALTGGGPDLVEVERVLPGPLRPQEGGGGWRGTGFAPVAAGPCDAGRCPEDVEITLVSGLDGGMPGGPVAVRATVFHLVADG